MQYRAGELSANCEHQSISTKSTSKQEFNTSFSGAKHAHLLILFLVSIWFNPKEVRLACLLERTRIGNGCAVETMCMKDKKHYPQLSLFSILGQSLTLEPEPGFASKKPFFNEGPLFGACAAAQETRGQHFLHWGHPDASAAPLLPSFLACLRASNWSGRLSNGGGASARVVSRHLLNLLS
eukprot:1161685-Pelagomonas_calceolata.AAC.25